VSLRSDEGSIVSVPYGQIGTIENFSRDWVTETFSFRAPFETGIQLVLGLFNRIGVVLKAEFTAKPGRQSAIRQAALQAAISAFGKTASRPCRDRE
jgi:small-conductance mechanosensitive channel